MTFSILQKQKHHTSIIQLQPCVTSPALVSIITALSRGSKEGQKMQVSRLRVMTSSKEPWTGLKACMATSAHRHLWYMSSYQRGSHSGQVHLKSTTRRHNLDTYASSVAACGADGHHVVLPFFKSHTAHFCLLLACTCEVNKCIFNPHCASVACSCARKRN